MSGHWVKGVPARDQARAQAVREEAGVTLADELAPANPDQELELLPGDEPPAPGDFRPRELPEDAR